MAIAPAKRFVAHKRHKAGASVSAAVKAAAPPATFIPATPPSITGDVLVGAWNALAQSPQSPLFSDIMLDSPENLLD
jgi:hypothetical protein